MAVKAVNDTAGPDGLVPTLLVFGAFPRMNTDSPPSQSTLKRAEAIAKATKALRKAAAERQLNAALHSRNGPDVTHQLTLPLQSDVRVWREKEGWQGPFNLLATGPVMISTLRVLSTERRTPPVPVVEDGDMIPVRMTEDEDKQRGQKSKSNRKEEDTINGKQGGQVAEYDLGVSPNALQERVPSGTFASNFYEGA
jgi:hypothetical protein